MIGKLTVEIDGKEEVREIELTAEQEKLFEKKKEIWFYNPFLGAVEKLWENDEVYIDRGRIVEELFKCNFAAYSEEECLERKKAADLKAEYQEWADKCNGGKQSELDWGSSECKWFVIYNHFTQELEMTSKGNYQSLDIYFKDGNKAWDFINRIGEPAFKKYILEVQE